MVDRGEKQNSFSPPDITFRATFLRYFLRLGSQQGGRHSIPRERLENVQNGDEWERRKEIKKLFTY